MTLFSSYLLSLTLSIIALFSIANAANHKAPKQEHHLHKKGLITSDGIVYSEYFVTSTLPPVTYYYTSYWTSYYTYAITQYSTFTYGDSSTVTKTYIAPTTSVSVGTTQPASTESTTPSSTTSTSASTSTSTSSTSSTSTSTSSSSPSSFTSTLSPSSSSTSTLSPTSTLLPTSISSSPASTSASSSLASSTTNLFEAVAEPYFVTDTSDSTSTRVYYYEDIYYDDSGSATSTVFEKYIGSGTPTISVYSTSTSTKITYITITV